jgi:hypothetical protein
MILKISKPQKKQGDLEDEEFGFDNWDPDYYILSSHQYFSAESLLFYLLSRAIFYAARVNTCSK